MIKFHEQHQSVLPRFRSITSSNSAKVPACLDAFANSTKSSRPTACFSADTTASNGTEVVTLKRSISNLLVDIFILPPCTRPCSRIALSKSGLERWHRGQVGTRPRAPLTCSDTLDRVPACQPGGAY